MTGQGRMGKTSLARQLESRLGDAAVSMDIDGQAPEIDPGLLGFLYDIAVAIAAALELPPPAWNLLQQRPTASFERDFLPWALEAAGQCRLVLIVDEFEELELRVASGKLSADIFSFLRQ